MRIQFVYVQKKENLEEFIFIFKNKNDIENLNERIYNILYSDNIDVKDNKINFIKLFYVKKGLVIKYNDEIWNKIKIINYKNLDIKDLIDNNVLLSIEFRGCLHFDYKKNKNEIDNIIIESFLLDKV